MSTNTIIRSYKVYPILATLYVTIMLVAISMVYNIIQIHGIDLSASTIVMPFWFFLGDVITEIYGYKLARRLIWTALFCEFVFVFACSALIRYTIPSLYNHTDSFVQVFGNLPRVFLGSFIGILFGSFLNSFIISKWKILVKGRYFWLRSIGSSGIGEGIFTMITISCDYLGVFPISKVLELILVSFCVKLAFTSIAVVPATIAAYFLKKLEGVDTYDYGINFNPFMLDTEYEQSNFSIKAKFDREAF